MSYVQKKLSKKVIAGKAQVLFLICINRDVRFRYKTPCFVEPEYWNIKGNDFRTVTKVTKLTPKAMKAIRDYRSMLTDIEKKIQFLITEFPDQVVLEIADLNNEGKKEYWVNIVLDALKDIASENLTREKVLSVFASKKTEDDEDKIESLDFFNLTKTFLEKRNVCTVRRNAYNVMFRSMARYEIFRNKVTGIDWKWSLDGITSGDMEAFFEYFRNERSYRDKYGEIFDEMIELYPIEKSEKHKRAVMKEKGDNYMACVQKRMKAFWNWALQNKLTTNNPFIGLEICHERYGTPYYITVEERNTIADADFSDDASLEIQRDIFVFQCLVGCRVGDMEKFTMSNIVNGILIYTPHKTKDESVPMTARVPLSKRALDIIEKYDGLDHKGRLLPFIARANYNECIKKILRKCEITRMVNVRDSITGENKMMPICDVASSHMARRTFVGNAYKQVKDADLVGKMSGHVEGSKAFSRYRNIDDDMLRDVINSIQ